MADKNDIDIMAGSTPFDEPAVEAEAAPAVEATAEPVAGPVPESPAVEEPAPLSAEPEIKDIRIPKSRFDEVNERRKVAEAKLIEMEQRLAQTKAPVNVDLDGMEKAYMTAVLDGDQDKALEIRRQIRAAEERAIQDRIAQFSTTTREETKASLALEATIKEVQAKYPVFDENSEVFKPEYSEEALELFQTFAQKLPRDLAMRKAVEYVVKVNGLESPTPVSPPVAPRPTGLRQKLEAANAQPPVIAGRAAAPMTTDILSMTDDEFDALPVSEIRRLRGDRV